MNHQQTIQELSKRSGESTATCEAVMTAYEKYAEEHIKKSGYDHLEDIAEALSLETNLNIQICKNILNQFFTLLTERTSKIPFFKNQGGNIMKKLIIAAIAIVGLGVASQIVESTMDKEAVKDYVTTNFTTPEDEQRIVNNEENGGN